MLIYGGWSRGRVVKFTCSAAGGPVFRWFESWARTWHCSSNNAEAVSHMPQLEGPTTKNIQLCTRGLWGERKKIKSLKKNVNIFKKKKKKPDRFEKERRNTEAEAECRLIKYEICQ